jgi:hypothetical protein
MDAKKDRLDQLEALVLKENLALSDLRGRLDRLETQALKANQGLLDLLGRLESVLAAAQQFWYQKITTLHWMIIILVLVVMDRLLLHFPQIVEIVKRLL